jgi:hypothetical protein
MTEDLPSAYSQAIAVSWQTLNREEVKRRLNSDRYPDFRWYRASDDYDPEQVNFDIWDTEGRRPSTTSLAMRMGTALHSRSICSAPLPICLSYAIPIRVPSPSSMSIR